jgi:N-acetyl-gamma-glutamyl-phosphate reductase
VIKVGVYGATGYTGFELIRILRRHPDVSLTFATSESRSGARLSDVFPVPDDLSLISGSASDPGTVDVVFCCLPHGAAMETVAAALNAGASVVDLSADFRLRDLAVYEAWYGLAHTVPHLLPKAVYGLPEVYRQQIRGANLVANPGCYPTSVLLALYPLLQAHFVEASQNFSPYNIGRAHRHLPEMAQEIEGLGGQGSSLVFSPHLTPVDRGILSTVYVPVPPSATIDTLHNAFNQIYAQEPFVWLLPEGQLATMAHAVRTNLCALSLTLASPGQLIVCSAIDNLLKGASGQAVQNFNLMFDLEETLGLTDS